MRKFFTIALLTSFTFFAHGQYVTPGDGETYSMDDLVNISQGVVTFDDDAYIIHEDLTISENDILEILGDFTIKTASEKRIVVYGALIADPQEELLFTAVDPENRFRGFRFEEASSTSLMRNTIVEYAGGIQLIDTDMLFENCTIRYFDRSNTSAAINLSGSDPVIQHCYFLENGGSAIGSGTNVQASPQILHNEFIRNSSENTNRPQINMGPGGSDTLKIIGNYIEGEYVMAGGIALSNFLSVGHTLALIKDNHIVDNRYGIASQGSQITAVITGNIILDNNIQGEPMQGGSGLNFLGGSTNQAYVHNNVIRGNLWGVTIQNEAQPNLGEEDQPLTGFNVIEDNENNGVIYGLYNNTPGPITAQNNYWGTEDEETAAGFIFDEEFDPDLGPVTFLPIWIPENMMYEFVFEADLNESLEEDVTGTIDQDELSVHLLVPFDANIEELIPTIQYSDYASVSPESGETVDFTDPVNFVVTAAHGEERHYLVTVVQEAQELFTLTFVITDPEGEDLENAVVTLNGETAEPGYYVFPDLEPGTYEYIVEKEGYSTEEGTVEIEDQDETVEVTLDPETGIFEASAGNLTVFPIPARDYINVRFEQGSRPADLRIYSLTGSLLKEVQGVDSGSRIDVSGFKNGIYLLQVTDGQQTHTKRFSVAR